MIRINFLFLLVSLFIWNCNSKEKDDNSAVVALVALGANNAGAISNSKSCSTTVPSCSGTTTFQNITQNAKYTNCTNCHNSPTGFGNFDFSNYSNAINKVNTSSPSSSILWQKVASCYDSIATMRIHSDSTFNDLIYCWISSGAPQ